MNSAYRQQEKQMMLASLAIPTLGIAAIVALTGIHLFPVLANTISCSDSQTACQALVVLVGCFTLLQSSRNKIEGIPVWVGTLALISYACIMGFFWG